MQNKQFEMSELYGVILEVIESGGEFRLFPRGTSMRPLLREGKDSVLLRKADTVKKHDICLTAIFLVTLRCTDYIRVFKEK